MSAVANGGRVWEPGLGDPVTTAGTTKPLPPSRSKLALAWLLTVGGLLFTTASAGLIYSAGTVQSPTAETWSTKNPLDALDWSYLIYIGWGVGIVSILVGSMTFLANYPDKKWSLVNFLLTLCLAVAPVSLVHVMHIKETNTAYTQWVQNQVDAQLPGWHVMEPVEAQPDAPIALTDGEGNVKYVAPVSAGNDLYRISL